MTGCSTITVHLYTEPPTHWFFLACLAMMYEAQPRLHSISIRFLDVSDSGTVTLKKKRKRPSRWRCSNDLSGVSNCVKWQTHTKSTEQIRRSTIRVQRNITEKLITDTVKHRCGEAQRSKVKNESKSWASKTLHSTTCVAPVAISWRSSAGTPHLKMWSPRTLWVPVHPVKSPHLFSDERTFRNKFPPSGYDPSFIWWWIAVYLVMNPRSAGDESWWWIPTRLVTSPRSARDESLLVRWGVLVHVAHPPGSDSPCPPLKQSTSIR